VPSTPWHIVGLLVEQTHTARAAFAELTKQAVPLFKEDDMGLKGRSYVGLAQERLSDWWVHRSSQPT